MHARGATLLAAIFAAYAHGAEPVVGTGDAAREAAEAPAAEAPSATPHETVVTEPRAWAESREVGTYHQPGWTDRRRFPGTRVYVAPEGTFTFEFWLEDKAPFDGEPNRLRSLYEVAVGLGHRLQLDLYLRTEENGTDPMFVESERLELRWALADWGRLWGNPTLYVEWIRQTEGPMKGELKLLLGDAFTERLYWGLNLFWERELWGTTQGHEYGLTAGLSYSLIDSKLALGAELQLELVDTRTSRPSPLEVELLVGPSLSFHPVPHAHLLLVAFVGGALSRADASSPLAAHALMQPTLVLGWRL